MSWLMAFLPVRVRPGRRRPGAATFNKEDIARRGARGQVACRSALPGPGSTIPSDPGPLDLGPWTPGGYNSAHVLCLCPGAGALRTAGGLRAGPPERRPELLRPA